MKREDGPPGGASGGGQVTGRGSSGARRPEVQARGPFRTRGLGLDGFPRIGFPRRLGKALVVTDVFVSLPSVFVTGVKIASVFGFCRTGCGVCCGCLFSSHSPTFILFFFFVQLCLLGSGKLSDRGKVIDFDSNYAQELARKFEEVVACKLIFIFYFVKVLKELFIFFIVLFLLFFSFFGGENNTKSSIGTCSC